MSVGDKVLALRARLRHYPTRDDCASFADKPVYTLGMTFFPGDVGLYDPTRASVSTIILGTDWGNEKTLADDLAATKYKSNATVRNTDRMLREAGFNLDDCFYTNAWLVLRAGNMREQNHHPMRDDEEFTNAYREFFRETLRTLEPKLVISLGFAAAWFLAPFFGEDWALGKLTSPKDIRTRHFDNEPLCVRDGVVFVNATHPSHLHNRDLRQLSEDETETALLNRARKLANIPDAVGAFAATIAQYDGACISLTERAVRHLLMHFKNLPLAADKDLLERVNIDKVNISHYPERLRNARHFAIHH